MKDPKIIKKKENINIALVGHMGSGKSIIGKLISKKLKLIHVDSDKIIEQTSEKTINSIFEENGEKYFRKIEEEVILKLNIKKRMVLSLGGGSLLSQKVRKFLKKHFITVFINIDIKVLASRLKNSSKRPLLKDTNIEQKLNELDFSRKKYYLQSEIIIEKYDTPENIISELLNKYKKINEKNNKD